MIPPSSTPGTRGQPELACPDCGYNGPPSEDGACPKCQGQGMQKPSALLVDPGTTSPPDPLRRLRFGSDRALTAGVEALPALLWTTSWTMLGCLSTGFALWFLADIPGQVSSGIAQFSWDWWDPSARVAAVFGTGLLVTMDLIAGLALGGFGLWSFRHALEDRGDASSLPGSGRVPVESARVELHELGGRAGLALHLSLLAEQLREGERVEVTARLRTASGEYCKAGLRAFEGEGGELCLRALTLPHLPDGSSFQDLGLFLPLRALEERAGEGQGGLTAEILVFADGVFQSRAEVPVPRFRRPDAEEGAGTELAREEIRILEGQEPSGKDAASCPICGDVLDGAVVACARCLTPHHAECWDFAGRCSTYACESTHCRPAGETGPAELVPTTRPALPALPRAELLRHSDRSIVGEPGAGFEALCHVCGKVVQTVTGGRCPTCQRPVLEELPVVVVPRAPTRFSETPLVLLSQCALLITAPLVLLGGLALWSPLLLFVLAIPVVAICLFQPQLAGEFLRLPAALAGDLLARAYPSEGARNHSPCLHLCSVKLLPPPTGESGFRVRILYLVRDLEGCAVEAVLRLCGPDGRYLPPCRLEDRGVFGEFRIRHLSTPLASEEPGAREFLLGLPGRPCPFPEEVQAAELRAEVLLACEGEVLSEADPVLRWERPEHGGPTAPASSEQALRIPEADQPLLGEKLCATCGERLLPYGTSCRRCLRRHHRECWDFHRCCSACGAGESAPMVTRE